MWQEKHVQLFDAETWRKKTTFGRRGLILKYNIKVDLKNRIGGRGVDSSGSR